MIDATFNDIKKVKQELAELKEGLELIAKTMGKVIDTIESHGNALTEFKGLIDIINESIYKRELAIDHVQYEMTEDEQAKIAEEGRDEDYT